MAVNGKAMVLPNWGAAPDKPYIINAFRKVTPKWQGPTREGSRPVQRQRRSGSLDPPGLNLSTEDFFD
jgi:hypothetical protein